MTKCSKHNINLECMGGCSAHPSNWYCPLCDRENEKPSYHLTVGSDMEIEFYNIGTGEKVPTENFFVLNGKEVWTDNEAVYESQAQVIGFDDCIRKCANIGWRIAP